MKFFYIDHSYLENTTNQSIMRERLFKLSQTEGIQFIFISAESVDASLLKRFLDICHDFDIQVLMSPAVFKIDGIMGTLTAGSFMLDGFPNMQTYPGSFLYGDSEHHFLQRVYLEFFPDHHEDMDSLMLNKELEAIMHDIVVQNKKSKNNRYN